MVHGEGVALLLRGVDFGMPHNMYIKTCLNGGFLFATRRDLIKRMAFFWVVVVAVAFPVYIDRKPAAIQKTERTPAASPLETGGR